jgi:hypothetical protein
MTLSDRERQALAEIESRLRLHRPSRFWRLIGWLRYGLFGRRFRRLPRRGVARVPAGRWPRRRPPRPPRGPVRMISRRRAFLLAALALAVGVLIGLAFAL